MVSASACEEQATQSPRPLAIMDEPPQQLLRSVSYQQIGSVHSSTPATHGLFLGLDRNGTQRVMQLVTLDIDELPGGVDLVDSNWNPHQDSKQQILMIAYNDRGAPRRWRETCMKGKDSHGRRCWFGCGAGPVHLQVLAAMLVDLRRVYERGLPPINFKRPPCPRLWDIVCDHLHLNTEALVDALAPHVPQEVLEVEVAAGFTLAPTTKRYMFPAQQNSITTHSKIHMLPSAGGLLRSVTSAGTTAHSLVPGAGSSSNFQNLQRSPASSIARAPAGMQQARFSMQQSGLPQERLRLSQQHQSQSLPAPSCGVLGTPGCLPPGPMCCQQQQQTCQPEVQQLAHTLHNQILPQHVGPPALHISPPPGFGHSQQQHHGMMVIPQQQPWYFTSPSVDNVNRPAVIGGLPHRGPAQEQQQQRNQLFLSCPVQQQQQQHLQQLYHHAGQFDPAAGLLSAPPAGIALVPSPAISTGQGYLTTQQQLQHQSLHSVYPGGVQAAHTTSYVANEHHGTTPTGPGLHQHPPAALQQQQQHLSVPHIQQHYQATCSLHVNNPAGGVTVPQQLQAAFAFTGPMPAQQQHLQPTALQCQQPHPTGCSLPEVPGPVVTITPAAAAGQQLVPVTADQMVLHPQEGLHLVQGQPAAVQPPIAPVSGQPTVTAPGHPPMLLSTARAAAVQTTVSPAVQMVADPAAAPPHIPQQQGLPFQAWAEEDSDNSLATAILPGDAVAISCLDADDQELGHVRLLITSLLGVGGNGVAYLATLQQCSSIEIHAALESGMQLVIKVPRLLLQQVECSKQPPADTDETAAEYTWIKKEFTVMDDVKICEQVVACYAHGRLQHCSKPYIQLPAVLLEYCNLGSWGDLLFPGGRLGRPLIKRDASTVHYIIKGLLPALTFLSDNNIIHSDIKPDNIMLKGRSLGSCRVGAPAAAAYDSVDDAFPFEVKLGDFGCARWSRGGLARTQNIGTRAFHAPEMGSKSVTNYGSLADSYAAAMCLLVGRSGVQCPFTYMGKRFADLDYAQARQVATDRLKELPKMYGKDFCTRELEFAIGSLQADVVERWTPYMMAESDYIQLGPQHAADG